MQINITDHTSTLLSACASLLKRSKTASHSLQSHRKSAGTGTCRQISFLKKLLEIQNHVADLEWGMVSICNLYSTVFTHKPSTSQLTPDDKNLDYIEKLVTDGEFDKIVIAWGSSLHSNKNTNEAKLRILKMLMEKGLTSKVKHIVGEFMDAKAQTGTHVLYLGLHNSRESWSCEDYPVQDAIKELEIILSMKEDKAVKEAEPLKITPMKKKGRKKNDVLQDSKQA